MTDAQQAVIVIAIIWVAYGVVALIANTPHHKMRRTVFRNLDSAAENGYFEPGEHLHGMSADEIAYDMTVYAADCEGLRPEIVVPYVRDWCRRAGL